MQSAEEIDVHHAAKDFGPCVRERASKADARVVDQYIDAPERVTNGRHGRLHSFGIGDVAGEGERLDAGALELLEGSAQRTRR